MSAKTGRFSIVCLSRQDWHAALPTNRQQVMARAGRRGHAVLFVETGHFLGRHLWTLARGPGRRSLARRLLVGEEVAPNVRVRKAPNVLPWGQKYERASAVNRAVTSAVVRRLAARAPGPVVLWLYDPCASRRAGAYGEAAAVYDCVDDYAEQVGSEARRRALVAAADERAAANSSLVFTTTTPLYRRHRRLNGRTYLVPNAGDYEHFEGAADRATAAPETRGLARPVLGFAGNFAGPKVDLALVRAVAAARPDWTVLLIGPAPPERAADLAEVCELPNVRWVGPRPYAELPRYVAAFDVALIPYASNAYTRSCFPLKLYEYLAAGKPVVASGLPELRGMEPDVVVADGVQEFVRAVEAALDRTRPEDGRRRGALAARNSWETRTERLLGLVTGELAR